MTDMADQVVQMARRIFVQEAKPGRVVERAALNGAYDKGSIIQDRLEAAEQVILKQRPEAADNE